MFKEKGEISIVNKFLISMLVIICILAVVLILMTKLNKKSVETHVKETQGMIQNYATNEKNTWDVSANGDGSVTATLLDDGTLTISGTGKMKDWVYTDTTDWHNSEIKEKVKKVIISNGVTSIGKYGFYECNSLISIKIPSSVTSIGYFAFYKCSSVTSINIPSGVTSIESGTFERCSSLTSINIPEGVISIVGNAFSECSSLTEIKVDEKNQNYIDDNGVLYTKDKKEIRKFPEGKDDITYTILEGVISIGGYAFEGCSSLTSINIPSSVISIGGYAFEGCSSLTSINIPSSVISIGSCAFWGCSNLTSINIPSGVTSIRDNAFFECKITKLVNKGEEIELPNILQRTQNKDDILYTSKEISLTNCTIKERKIIIDENKTYAKIYIQDGALNGLTYVLLYNEWDVSKNGDGSVIATLSDDGTLTISGTGNMKDFAVNATTDWHKSEIKAKIKNVVINSGVKSIGYNAFNGCSNLTIINIPSSVTSIVYGTFYGCSSLTSINIPEGVTSIGDSAFYKCSSLTSINIPSSVTSIGYLAFYRCSSLTSINIPEGVLSIVGDAFNGCSSLIEIKVDEKNQNYIDDNGVLYTKDKKGIRKFPEGKDDITYTILEGVTSIGDNAFYGCSSLTSINIPEGVTSIGRNAFSECSSLTSINIPEGVKSIGINAFEGCSSLTSINIPSSVTSIKVYAFRKCSSLTEIKVDEKNQNYIDDNGVLYTKDTKEIIKFPEGKGDITYTILEGVTSISGYAFYRCRNLISINIPSSVTNIEKDTFSGCENLTIICRSDSTAETYAQENEISYKVDDEGPIVNLSINGTTKPVIEVSSTITVEDELAGLVEESIKYIWSTQSENITREEIVNSFSNGEKLNIKDVTGTYYLWIYAKDKLGNESIVRSEAFIIDNTAPTVSASYSTTTKTNQNVRVTITSNEEIQELSGWTLSTDKKVLTKEYTQNKTETIKIKDIAGNETQVKVEISNIDKTAPEIKVDYIQETNEKVKVIITANEEIQELSGWTLSSDKKVLTKEYTKNTTENVTIKDIAGNTKTAEISVMEIGEIFKENTYKVNRNYIVNIQPKTTYENFIKNIATNSEYKVTEDNQEATGNTIIKTGQKLTIGDQTFTLVVIGDTNGDGQANIKDILDINKHRLNKAQLVNEYLQAGDINEDGKVNLRDILQINKYRLGKISEL